MRAAWILVLRLMWARLISAETGKSSGRLTGNIDCRVVLLLVGEVGIWGIGAEMARFCVPISRSTFDILDWSFSVGFSRVTNIDVGP